jgi:hypothetical protein
LEGKPADLVRGVNQFGFEGILAKRLDSFYESGKRSGVWLYRINKGQEFVIGGYVPGNPVDSIIVGYYRRLGDRFREPAGCGTGRWQLSRPPRAQIGGYLRSNPSEIVAYKAFMEAVFKNIRPKRTLGVKNTALSYCRAGPVAADLSAGERGPRSTAWRPMDLVGDNIRGLSH